MISLNLPFLFHCIHIRSQYCGLSKKMLTIAMDSFYTTKYLEENVFMNKLMLWKVTNDHKLWLSLKSWQQYMWQLEDSWQPWVHLPPSRQPCTSCLWKTGFPWSIILLQVAYSAIDCHECLKPSRDAAAHPRPSPLVATMSWATFIERKMSFTIFTHTKATTHPANDRMSARLGNASALAMSLRSALLLGRVCLPGCFHLHWAHPLDDEEIKENQSGSSGSVSFSTTRFLRVTDALSHQRHPLNTSC